MSMFIWLVIGIVIGYIMGICAFIIEGVTGDLINIKWVDRDDTED